MKSAFAIVAAASGLLASAIPILDGGVSDVANGMLDVLLDNATCAPVAVIFARGTFDSGNLGVWVGPQFLNAISDNLGAESVALQGVEPGAYKADLEGYMAEGGSNDGAASLATFVDAYATKCPKSAIVVSGWSQGALVAHKALSQLSEPALSKVAGLVTFGDPNGVWDDLPLPESIPEDHFHSSCVTGFDLDPLCADLPLDFSWPTSPKDFVDPILSLPSVAVGMQQAEAALSIKTQLPGEILSNFWSLVENLTPDQFVRLLLTPQHFRYGNNGMAKKAADFVADLPGVKGAL